MSTDDEVSAALANAWERLDAETPRGRRCSRVAESCKRMGVSPDAMIIICTEDPLDMKPLTTEAGQKWVDGLIRAYGGFDGIVFDNLQALTVDNLRETDVWEGVKPCFPLSPRVKRLRCILAKLGVGSAPAVPYPPPEPPGERSMSLAKRRGR